MSEDKMKLVKVRVTEAAYDRLQSMYKEHECGSASELVRKLVQGLVPPGPYVGPEGDKVDNKALCGPTESGEVGKNIPPVPEGAAEVRFLISKKAYDTMVSGGIDIVTVCKAALSEPYNEVVGKRKK